MRFCGSGVYLVPLLLSPLFGQFVQYLFPNTTGPLFQPWSVAANFFLFSCAVLLWIPAQTSFAPSRNVRSFFVVLIVSWLGAVVASLVHVDALTLAALLPVSAAAMILVKIPSWKAVKWSADTFAWAIIIFAALAQILDALGIKTLKYEGWNRTWIQVWDLFPFLFNVIDYGSRWEGPFGNVNFAGPMGAFLVVYGFVRKSRVSWFFVVVGGVILFVSDSRAAWVSAIVAVLVFFILKSQRDRRNSKARMLAVILALAALSAFIYALISDTSPTGRGLFWQSYLREWVNAPFIGIGGSGIRRLTETGELPAMATHGHNLLVDPLLRYGLITTIFIGTLVALAFVIGVRSESPVRPASMALVSLFLVSGLAEDLVNWPYLSLYLTPLVLGVLTAVSWEKCGKSWLR